MATVTPPIKKVPPKIDPFFAQEWLKIEAPERFESKGEQTPRANDRQATYNAWTEFLTPSSEVTITEEVTVQESNPSRGSMEFKVGGTSEIIFQNAISETTIAKDPSEGPKRPEIRKSELKLSIPLVGVEQAQKVSKFSYKQGKDMAGAVGEIFTLIFGFGEKKKKDEKPKTPEELQKQNNKRISLEGIKNVIAIMMGGEAKRRIRKSAESANENRQSGMSRNASYEGSIDKNGQMFTYAQIDVEKVNSKKNEDEIRADRQRKLNIATKGKAGNPGVVFDLNRSHQANSVTKLAG